MSHFIEYPISQMDFVNIRKHNMVYVDKTGIMFQLVRTNASYFLSRPRRFGKSMLISTMKAFFQGQKELFKGLEIEKLEQDWTCYPVIHIDLSRSKYVELSNLHSMLNRQLTEYEQQYDIKPLDTDGYSSRLLNIIQTAHKVTQQLVVVLVDEYDAPMLDNIDNPTQMKVVRNILRDLFSPLKAMAQHLRFVFLTGVTKFAQLSIFSELNNLTNISMDPRFETICGITQEELISHLHNGIEELALVNGESVEQAIEHLKRLYDGYHFSSGMTSIYNPYSLINVLSSKQYKNYWFGSGTPTMLIELMKHYNLSVIDLESIEANESRFDRPAEQIDDAVPVLYQSGYITIKKFDPSFNFFTLGIPNEEVREGLYETMYEYYKPSDFSTRDTFARAIREFYNGGSIEDFMEALKAFYLTIPYGLDNANEKHYQALFFAAMQSSGANVQAEAQTATGRIDIVMTMPHDIYIFEFKYKKDAETAAKQIRQRNYAQMFAASNKAVHQVALNVNADNRTIDSWTIV